MNELTYLRAGAATVRVHLGNPPANVLAISDIIRKAGEEKVNVLVMPELCVTGYTCGDLFRSVLLLDSAERACLEIARATRSTGVTAVFGAPLRCAGLLFNCAVVASEGEIKGVVPKSFLPNYNEFYERRWFAPAASAEGISEIAICGVEYPFGTDLLFNIGGYKVGVEICEDLWVPVSPSCAASQAGAVAILNLSASPEQTGKSGYLRNLVAGQSGRLRCAYVYASAGAGESSTDLVFCGYAMIAEDGVMLAEKRGTTVGDEMLVVSDIDANRLMSDRQYLQTFYEHSADKALKFRSIDCGETSLPEASGELRRFIDAHPFVPSRREELESRCDEIFSIQASGLARRLEAAHCRKVTIGISGGLDSTLALLVAVRAFDMLGLDRAGISGITMPGFGTTGRTHGNAVKIMKGLGVSMLEINISKSVSQHFADIGQDPEVHDVTYENCQARERTQILMDYANRTGGMVVGTGDLSELALGWCTYNGDQMSMYGVNASVPKTLVKFLVERYAESHAEGELKDALLDIVATPISPELIPADDKGNIVQKTEDLVGPYELHDFFIYNMIRASMPPRKIYYLARKAFAGIYDDATIKHWLTTFYRRFFAQQFKRSCMPDGPKVGSVCLSPRGDWRMPSDAESLLFTSDVEGIKSKSGDK